MIAKPIVTVTPNPSIDRTLDVEALRPGRLNRALRAHVHPGGKGVNVARALAARRHPVRTVVPHGGPEGDQLLALLADLGIDVVPVPGAAGVRVNVAIVDPDGTTTKVNEPGAPADASLADAILGAVDDAARSAGWVVTAGSLPPGLPEDFHARIVAVAHAAGARVAVDASGTGFTRAVAAGADLVKPNRRELEEAVGRPVRTLGDAVTAARELIASGADEVLASLGPAGALLVASGADKPQHGESPVAVVRSTVGAGDTLLAGYLAGGGGADGLQTGLAWAAESISCPGTSLLAPPGTPVPVVLVSEDIDGSRTLDAPVQNTNEPATGAGAETGLAFRGERVE